jgi:hypothetical protein
MSSVKDSLRKIKEAQNHKDDDIEDEKLSFFSARVPESFKNHWKAEIAREGRSVKDVLIELLTKKYGLPRKDQT